VVGRRSRRPSKSPKKNVLSLPRGYQIDQSS
jgi:hypothetical protein